MELDCLSVGLLVADHLCAPIPQLPRAGQLVLTDHLLLSIGGCASNAAMDLARVGVKVGVVGCVGADVFGRFVIETLESAGVETSSIHRLEGVGTSGTLIVNVAGEDRRFIHSVGANGKLTAADIPLDRVRQAKVLYVGGYLLMPSLDADELATLFRQARTAGIATVLDVVLPGPGDHWSKLERLLPETDVFLPNNDEAAVITGLADPRRQAERFHEAGAEQWSLPAVEGARCWFPMACASRWTSTRSIMSAPRRRRRLRCRLHRRPARGGRSASVSRMGQCVGGQLRPFDRCD